MIQPLGNDSVVSAALAGLFGDRMYAVTFILDYIQLQFDEHGLNAYSLVSVVREGNVVRQGEEPFRNALCGQIGKHVTECRLDTKYLEIGFGDVQIRLSLVDEDYVGPEAGQFFSPKAELIFRADGIHTMRKAVK